MTQPAQRIGLSATVRPPEEVARFLSGQAPTTIVAPPAAKTFDLSVTGARARHGQPREQHDLARRRGAHRRPDRGAQLLDRVRQLPTARRATHLTAQRDSRRTHRRRTADRPQPAGGRRRPGPHHGQRAVASVRRPLLAKAHHGSVSKEQRALVEDDLKTGRLKAVVATSSLELGIDMGAVDLVIQVGDAAVGGQRAAAHRPRRPPGRRDLPGRAVPQTPHRPHRLRGDGAADAGRRDRDHEGARRTRSTCWPSTPSPRARWSRWTPTAGSTRCGAAPRSRRCRAARSRRRSICCPASTRRPSSPSCGRAWCTTATPAP